VERFFIYVRKSRKKNPRKADNSFYVWYRDPVSGEKKPDNRIAIDSLEHRLNKSGIKKHITSKTEAYCIAEEALKRGVVFNYIEPSADEEPLLIPFIQNFWNYDESLYIKRKKIEKSHITKNYCIKVLGCFNKHCKPLIPSGMKLSQMSMLIVERIKADMFDKGLSSSVINTAISSIKTPLSEAFRLELIKSNVAEKIMLIKRSDGNKGILTSEEGQRLVKYLKDNTPYDEYERWKYLTVALSYYAGLRNSEIQALSKNCIDIENGYLAIKHGYNYADKLKTTKNGKERIVTIPLELCRELYEYAKGSPSDFVFFSMAKPENPIDDRHISRNFTQAMEAIGISITEQKQRGLSFYSLRHGFNTSMVNSGLNESFIRTVTGHSSVAMTQHYYHQNEEALKKQAEVRNQFIPYLE